MTMDKVKQFFDLKELWKNSSETERTTIDAQISDLIESMDDRESEALAVGVQKDFENIHAKASVLEDQLRLREKLSPILPYISVSALAKEYFGKSSSWFYQRLNGNIVHGKECRFSAEEVERLRLALSDISAKIGSCSCGV